MVDSMINRVMSEKVYCGLDIGSKNIKAALLRVKDANNTELLGVVDTKTQGFKEGGVYDLNEFSECINATLNGLIKKTGVKFRDVYLGVSGDLLNIRQVNTEIPLIDRGSKVIVKRDIKKVNKQARLLSVKMEEEILHELPQFYRVDDVSSAINPLGLFGRKLGVQSSMVVMPSNRIQNLIKAVQKAGFDVVKTFYTTLVTASAVLNEVERKEGAVMLDIGARYSTLVIFKDNFIKHIASIPFGGNDLTRSIAQVINIPFDLAEEIKKSYAGAMNFDVSLDEEVLIKKDSQYLPIKKIEIYRSIESDLERFDRFVKTELGKSQILEDCPHGIVAFGGGALLSGLMERISSSVNLSVKLGVTNMFQQKNIASSAKYVSAIGLAQSGYKQTIGYSISSNGHSHWVQHILTRAQELYHEYF